jgi:hypothetical protein
MEVVVDVSVEEQTVEDSVFGEVPERVLTENMKEALNGGDN